ncbi:MAG TPA: diaminopimelate epimerase [Nitrospirales bacterium]|nr:diaminopimelate epimerase [Nitrospirales bacterium]HIN32797.1 diaminopimelate epimerase [Nitrospirales bacterium]
MIPFMKLAGSGNDFILIDNRRGALAPTRLKRLAIQLCRRRWSVGADGLIVIEPSSRADFKWKFFNADGSRAGFCGNGARCAARFAHIKKIARRHMVFETRVGLIAAEVVSPRGERVKVRMPDPKGLRLDVKIPIDGQEYIAHLVDAGVPHCVYMVDDLDNADVEGLGRTTRNHRLFRPVGTNVNFINVVDSHRIGIRTYERGVEGETLACGTGSIAAAVIANKLAGATSPVTVMPASGLPLIVSFTVKDGMYREVFMEGDARVIYDGYIKPDALD